MSLFHYIRYWGLGAAFSLRRRLPLYMNDRARLASRYANALLTLFINRSISMPQKLALFERFSDCFSLDISARRLTDALRSDERGTAFLKAARAKYKPGSAKPHYERMLQRLEARMAREPVIDSRHIPRRKSYKTLHYDGRQFSVNAKPEAPQASKAILCLSPDGMDGTDIEIFKRFSEIIVLNPEPENTEAIRAELTAKLSPDTVLTLLDPRDHFGAPYSNNDQTVSDFCDNLGQALLALALKTPSIRRFVPPVIEAEIALDISDKLYRPVQQLHAALTYIQNCPPDLPLYVNTKDNPAAKIVAQEQSRPVFVLTDSLSHHQAEDGLEAPSPAFTRTELRRFFRQLNYHTETRLPKIDDSGEPQIIIAANSRHNSYKKALGLIQARIEQIAPVTVIDFAEPSQENRQIFNMAYFFKPGDPQWYRGRGVFSHALSLGLKTLLASRKLGQFRADDMATLLTDSLEEAMQYIIGNVVLYKETERRLRGITKAGLIMIPGRHAPIRCAARAFQTAGLPTLDVQILFVSEMSRYKVPAADYCSVIDSFARNLYTEKWGLDPNTVTPVGAILLDEAIVKAKAADRASLKDELYQSQNRKILTFGCQPLPDSEILAAANKLAHYAKQRPEIHLCIKLHPAQSAALKNSLAAQSEHILGSAGQFTLLHKTPFWKIIATTDILVSYFSNICLMAPAFNIPVITLPTSAPTPALSLADMGLAVQAKTLADIEAKLDQLIDGKPASGPAQPPQPYLARNPHMAAPESLERLARLMTDIFRF